VGACLSESFNLFLKHPVEYMLAVVAYGAIVLFSCGTGLFVILPLTTGLNVFVIKQLRGQSPQFSDIFGGFDQFLSLFILQWVWGLAVVVGALFCLLPGLAAAWLFLFAPLLVIDKGMSAFDAMSKSAEVVLAQLNQTIVLFLILMLVGALGAGTAFGALLTTPFATILTTVVYRDLFGLERAA
jgi:uncharacterized membrane protein